MKVRIKLLVSIAVLGLLVSGTASANDDYFSDSTNDVPTTAFPLNGISFGHGSNGKLVHRIQVGRSFTVNDLASGSSYGVSLNISTDGREFYQGYRIGVVKDPGWFRNTDLIGEIFKGGRFTARRVPVYKVGDTLRISFKPRKIGSPASYYMGAHSYGPGTESQCPDEYMIGKCWDYVADDLEFFHDI